MPSENPAPWAVFDRDWRRPSVPVSFSLHWDEEAGYGQLLPRPSPAEAAEFYSDIEYYTHGTSAAEDARGSFLEHLVFHLSWRLDRGTEPDRAYWSRLLGPAPAKVLEIGCGDGSNLMLIAGIGHAVVGVEPDPVSAAQARKTLPRVYPGTAEDLPADVTGERFDLVLMSHVLEHTIDPLKAVRNAKSVLSPSGVLVIEVPNNECLGRKVCGKAWFWLDVPRHLNFFSERSLTSLVASVGGFTCATEFRGYSRQFSQGWASQQDQVFKAFGIRARWNLAARLRYLLKTLTSTDRHKYDSVRVVARQVTAGGVPG